MQELTAGVGCAAEVAGAGNLAACRAFLMGVEVQDLPAGALAADDPAFPFVVTARMGRPADAFIRT